VAEHSLFDRMAARVRLTENLEMIEDSRSVVVAMTVVIWFGVVQALGSAIPLFSFDEPESAWAVIVAAAIFAVAWVWLAATGDLTGTIVVGVVAGAIPVYIHVALGGFAYSGGSMFFATLLVSVVALLLGRRSIAIMVPVYVVLIVVFGFLESTLQESRPPPDPTLTNALFVIVLITNLLVVPPLLVYLLGKLRAERERAESLLLNMLPAEVAVELKQEGSTYPKRFDSMSVLFADIVGFTPLSSTMSPEEVVDSLNTVFTHFDRLAEKHGVEKIRTIGDSYMAASGVPVARDDHAQVLAAMALEMLDYATGSRFSFRIGINSGPVVAGVIGTHKFQYDVWGDTVNTAYRMESHGETGRIQISEATNSLIRHDFATIPRGSIQVKGKGIMDTWFLEDSLATPQ
jgi:adenylate cyclase